MATPTLSPAVELRKADVLSAHTGEVVLAEVDWQVNAGDFWVIGGAYGSGKTDLLSTAAGLQRPDAGAVILFGQNTEGFGEPEMISLRLRIGMVFKHGGRMFANFTVLENLTLPLRYHQNLGPAESAKRLQPLLELCGLTDVANRIATTLGPNLRHRVGLARALALNPEVLVLDEPLSGLDPSAQRWTIDILHKSAQQPLLPESKPLTIIVGTNHFDPWHEHGTRFAILQNKRWLALSGREELKGGMLESASNLRFAPED